MPRFEFNGASQTFAAIANKKYIIDIWGASGGGSGGKGGHSQAIYSNTANATLYLYIGGTADNSSNASQIKATFNGGGAGGSSASGEIGMYNFGYAGGGATDIRTSTSTSNRILVAGGGGGGSGGGAQGGDGGYPTFSSNIIGNAGAKPGSPEEQWGNLWEKSSTGGWCGSINSAGAGGAAPWVKAQWGSDQSYPTAEYAGGGGGGGWYGGGGGSTSVAEPRTENGTNTGVAGASGSGANGGAGASKTTTYTGNGNVAHSNAGGGGGGSSYSATVAQLSGVYFDLDPNADGHGRVDIYEIISKPRVMSVTKDGNKIKTIVTKTSPNEEGYAVPEKFYYNYGLGYGFGSTTVLNPARAVIITGKDFVEIEYTIPSETKAGNQNFSFQLCNGLGEVVYESLGFIWNSTEPEVIFNEESLTKAFQGRSIKKAFEAKTGLINNSDIPLECEYILTINGNKYGDIFKNNSGDIYLPNMYDGVYNDVYSFTITARVGQKMNGLYGVGKVVWSKWFVSDEYIAMAQIIPVNTLEFITKLSDKGIEADTKLNLEWKINEGMVINDGTEFILQVFKDGISLTEFYCGHDTAKQLIMNYSQGENYQFGIMVRQNEDYYSEIVYSDKFQIADIRTDGDIINVSSERLDITTSIEQSFHHIEVLVNEDLAISSTENLTQKKIPLYKFNNGENRIEVKVYKTETIFIKHIFRAYLLIKEEDLTPIKTHDFTQSISINDERLSHPLNKEGCNFDGVFKLEEEFSSPLDLKEEEIQSITQKITVSKILDSELNIIGIYGGLME